MRLPARTLDLAGSCCCITVGVGAARIAFGMGMLGRSQTSAPLGRDEKQKRCARFVLGCARLLFLATVLVIVGF